MDGPRKTPQPGQAWGAGETGEVGNLNGKDTKPASILFAEADRIIESFPSFVTWKSKRQAESKVLRLFLAALATGRTEHGQAV